MNLLVEGWRFIPHSYACVNMWQCLELMKYKEVMLYHNDVPFFGPHWTRNYSIFEQEFLEKINSIGGLHYIDQADAIYRISFPFNLTPVGGRPVICFMTCESGHISPECVTGIAQGDVTPGSGMTIVTPSNWSKQGLVRCGIDPDLIEVVPHGVDPTLFTPVEPETRHGLRKVFQWENKFVFLHIGGMFANKGMDVLLKAFAIVHSKHPETMLCLKGCDSLYNSSAILREAAFLLNSEEVERVLQNSLYLSGDMPFSSVANLYQAADAYVAPYRAEGFNIPVLEAAACGIPIICTSGGPTDDFTLDSFAMRVESTLESEGENYVLEPSLDHLVYLMNKVVEDADFRENAAVFGPLNTHLNYTWEMVVDSLMGVITNLVRQSP